MYNSNSIRANVQLSHLSKRLKEILREHEVIAYCQRPSAVNVRGQFKLLAKLFDGDALRQIAWLVDVGAFDDGGMIGQKLHRDGVEDRCNKGIDHR